MTTTTTMTTMVMCGDKYDDGAAMTMMTMMKVRLQGKRQWCSEDDDDDGVAKMMVRQG